MEGQGLPRDEKKKDAENGGEEQEEQNEPILLDDDIRVEREVTIDGEGAEEQEESNGLDDERDTCTVCLDHVEGHKHKKCTVTACKHQYHIPCICDCARKLGHKCPNCRGKLDEVLDENGEKVELPPFEPPPPEPLFGDLFQDAFSNFRSYLRPLMFGRQAAPPPTDDAMEEGGNQGRRQFLGFLPDSDQEDTVEFTFYRRRNRPVHPSRTVDYGSSARSSSLNTTHPPSNHDSASDTHENNAESPQEGLPHTIHRPVPRYLSTVPYGASDAERRRAIYYQRFSPDFNIMRIGRRRWTPPEPSLDDPQEGHRRPSERPNRPLSPPSSSSLENAGSLFLGAAHGMATLDSLQNPITPPRSTSRRNPETQEHAEGSADSATVPSHARVPDAQSHRNVPAPAYGEIQWIFEEDFDQFMEEYEPTSTSRLAQADRRREEGRNGAIRRGGRGRGGMRNAQRLLTVREGGISGNRKRTRTTAAASSNNEDTSSSSPSSDQDVNSSEVARSRVPETVQRINALVASMRADEQRQLQERPQEIGGRRISRGSQRDESSEPSIKRCHWNFNRRGPRYSPRSPSSSPTPDSTRTTLFDANDVENAISRINLCPGASSGVRVASASGSLPTDQVPGEDARPVEPAGQRGGESRDQAASSTQPTVVTRLMTRQRVREIVSHTDSILQAAFQQGRINVMETRSLVDAVVRATPEGPVNGVAVREKARSLLRELLNQVVDNL